MVKTGGYVAARVVLAVINGATSALVFLIIGMPSWLALGCGPGSSPSSSPPSAPTSRSSLPVLVGLASPKPWIGMAALAWAILYQQVENLTLEPRISARAVNLHPAVAFASVHARLGAVRRRRGPAGHPGRRPCCWRWSTPTWSGATW